jgi:hypothetical protein
MYNEETGFEDVNAFKLTLDTVQWWALVNTVLSFRVLRVTGSHINFQICRLCFYCNFISFAYLKMLSHSHNLYDLECEDIYEC